MKLIVSGCAALFLAACAGAGEKSPTPPARGDAADLQKVARADCRDADWFEVGERDGLYGEDAGKLAERQARCAAFGVAVNETDYQDGRARGLRSYCRPDRGFDAGRNGRDYRGVCPAEAEAAFLAEYRIGRRLYDLKTALATAEADLDKTKAKIGADRHELARALAIVGDRVHEDEARNAAAADVARLRHEIAALETDLPRLEAAITAAAKALDAQRALLETRAAPGFSGD